MPLVPPRPRVVVVAPVLNLSGSADFDPLRVTDILASELQAFPGHAATPVNLTLAALAQRGLTQVESPELAHELAAEFGADATLVAAVTAYDPYDPPTIGLILQWYPAPRRLSAADAAEYELSSAEYAPAPVGPLVQIQQVFNAAHDDVCRDVKRYADRREAHESPYAWRRWVKSADLFVHYATHAAIRTMLGQVDGTTVDGRTE